MTVTESSSVKSWNGSGTCPGCGEQDITITNPTGDVWVGSCNRCGQSVRISTLATAALEQGGRPDFPHHASGRHAAERNASPDPL